MTTVASQSESDGAAPHTAGSYQIAGTIVLEHNEKSVPCGRVTQMMRPWRLRLLVDGNSRKWHRWTSTSSRKTSVPIVIP